MARSRNRFVRSLAAGGPRLRAVDRPLVLLAGISFTVQVGVAVMLPLLPLYAVSLGATPVVLGLLTSAFAVANALGGLATGFLAERFQPRRLVAGGIGFYALANLLIATATAALPLLAYRTVAGIGGGVAAMGERLYLTSVVDRARLATANGILSSAGAAGGVLGPVIGGLLAAAADVRAPFLVVAATSLVGAVGALMLPRPTRREAAASPRDDESDTAPSLVPAYEASEAALVTATVDALPSPAVAVGPSPSSRDPWSSRPVVGAGLRLLGILFVAQVAFQAAFGAFITTYAPFATERLGWSTVEVGLVYALFAVGTILLGPWLGRIADRRGRRDVAIVSCLLIALFPLAFVLEAPRLVIYPATFLAGTGVTGLEAAWFALLGEATDGGRRARAFGTVSSLANLGIVVGATVAAQLWERTDDVGLGMAVVVVSIAASGMVLLFLPRDRGAAGTTVMTAPPEPS